MKTILLLTIAALALPTSIFAQEDLHEKVRELQNKAGAAQAEGRADEAEKLRNAARELAKQAKAVEVKRADELRDKPQREDTRVKLEKLRHELGEAAKSGREDAAGEIKQHIAKLENALRAEAAAKERGDKRPEGKRPLADDVHQKLQHLGQAIEHLRAAGMKEPADALTEQAHALKRQLAGGEKHGGQHPEGDRQLAELREGMMNLQRQIQEMHKRLEELSRERK